MTNANCRLYALLYSKASAGQLTIQDKVDFKQLIDKLYYAIPVRVEYVDAQPYTGLAGITADITRGILQVSTQHNAPCPELMDKATNLRFRAVHDYQHYLVQGEFTFAGEWASYKYMASVCRTERLQKIMLSEIVLQASYAIVFGSFPIQKVVLI